jgi:hypothetical protein
MPAEKTTVKRRPALNFMKLWADEAVLMFAKSLPLAKARGNG